MLSEAAKRYQHLYISRPKNTPDRHRMYHSIDVQVPYHSANKRSIFEATTDRSHRDSYLLRVTKEMVLNTDHHPKYETVQFSNPKQVFSKGKFTRIIGDVRTEDYSVELQDNCDRRCSQAFLTLPHQQNIKTTKDVQRARIKQHHINFDKQLSRQKLSQSLDLKKMGSKKSTNCSETSQLQEIIKKRQNNKGMQIHNALKKIRKFEHDIGHKYGQILFTPKKVPEVYDIQNANEALVKQSMSVPRGNVDFSRFRNQIKTRYDRQDPLWSMNIEYDKVQENPEKSARTINLSKVLKREPNEVMSKYPIRQNMQVKIPLNL